MASKRTRNWNFLFYEEDCENWREVLDSAHIDIYVSPLHDADRKEDGTLKKPHRHGVMCFDSVKTYEQALAIVAPLGCRLVERTASIKNSLAYLCHSGRTDKVQYDVEDIVYFGMANSATYAEKVLGEQIEEADIMGLILLCKEQGISSLADLTDYILYEPDSTARESHWRALCRYHTFCRDYFNSLRWSE